MLADVQLLDAARWIGTMCPAPSRLNATCPGPLASVTKICIPAIIRFNAPAIGRTAIFTDGCFHSST